MLNVSSLRRFENWTIIDRTTSHLGRRWRLRASGPAAHLELLHMQHRDPRRVTRKVVRRVLAPDHDPAAIHLEGYFRRIRCAHEFGVEHRAVFVAKLRPVVVVSETDSRRVDSLSDAIEL